MDHVSQIFVVRALSSGDKEGKGNVLKTDANYASADVSKDQNWIKNQRPSSSNTLLRIYPHPMPFPTLEKSPKEKENREI